MRYATLVILFLGIITFAFPQSNAEEKTSVKATNDHSFWRHNAEFHVTPFACYYFYRQGKEEGSHVEKPYEFNYPLAGFDLGVRYTYRPFKVFGISTGLNFGISSSYSRHTSYNSFYTKYVDSREIGYGGYLTIPIEFHLYKQMRHSTFEFSTGPDFNFFLFARDKLIWYNETGEITVINHINNSGIAPFLGWNILLGAEISLTSKVNLFIGPQINFFSIAQYDTEANKDSEKWGQGYPFSFGLKLGLRFSCGKKK